jgi:hypothetical protein
MAIAAIPAALSAVVTTVAATTSVALPLALAASEFMRGADAANPENPAADLPGATLTAEVGERVIATASTASCPPSEPVCVGLLTNHFPLAPETANFLRYLDCRLESPTTIQEQVKAATEQREAALKALRSVNVCGTSVEPGGVCITATQCAAIQGAEQALLHQCAKAAARTAYAPTSYNPWCDTARQTRHEALAEKRTSYPVEEIKRVVASSDVRCGRVSEFNEFSTKNSIACPEGERGNACRKLEDLGGTVYQRFKRHVDDYINNYTG